MPIPPSSIERVDSGAGTVTVGSDGMMAREVELKFLVHSLGGFAAAEAKGRTLAALIYDGHRRSSLQCRPVSGGWYEISASYANSSIDSFERQIGILNDDDQRMIPVSVDVDTTGGTEHITQAWSDSPDPTGYVASYPEGAPDSHGAVNVSGDRVNGIDITVPAFQFTETWLVPAEYLLSGPFGGGTPYAKQLSDMAGTVNDDAFRVFEKGEVLFLGARFTVVSNQTMVPVTYSFSVRKTRRDFFVGSVPVAIKYGWDYLWIEYASETDAGSLVQKPLHVYVDRVYERKVFTGLKLSRSWDQFYLRTGEQFTHPIDPALTGQS
jgi:hypothetical protein